MRSGRDGRSEQRVELVLGEGGRDGLLHRATGALRTQVGRRRQQQAELEQAAHAVADPLGSSGNPGLVVRRSLGGDDRELGGEASFEHRDRDVLGDHACSCEQRGCLVDRGGDVGLDRSERRAAQHADA